MVRTPSSVWRVWSETTIEMVVTEQRVSLGCDPIRTPEACVEACPKSDLHERVHREVSAVESVGSEFDRVFVFDFASPPSFSVYFQPNNQAISRKNRRLLLSKTLSCAAVELCRRDSRMISTHGSDFFLPFSSKFKESTPEDHHGRNE